MQASQLVAYAGVLPAVRLPRKGCCDTFHTLNADIKNRLKMTASMDYGALAPAAGFLRTARRNDSLSSTGRILVFDFIFAVPDGIACAFAATGAAPYARI